MSIAKINVALDESMVKELINEKLEKHFREIENRYAFWDMKELCRQTCLSENNIKEKFFYDPRFPKYKVGQKWMFPAKKTLDFLLTWLSEQPNR